MAPKTLTTPQCIQEQFTCTFTYTRDVYRVKRWKTWNPSRPVNLLQQRFAVHRYKWTINYMYRHIFFLPWRNSPSGTIVEDSSSQTHHTPLDSSGRVISRDLHLTTHFTHSRQTSMSPAGFESTFPASERPQTHAKARTATGVGMCWHILVWNRAAQFSKRGALVE